MKLHSTHILGEVGCYLLSIYGSMAAFFVNRIKVAFYVETISSFQVAILLAASGNYLIRAAVSTLSELG